MVVVGKNQSEPSKTHKVVKDTTLSKTQRNSKNMSQTITTPMVNYPSAALASTDVTGQTAIEAGWQVTADGYVSRAGGVPGDVAI